MAERSEKIVAGAWVKVAGFPPDSGTLFRFAARVGRSSELPCTKLSEATSGVGEETQDQCRQRSKWAALRDTFVSLKKTAQVGRILLAVSPAHSGNTHPPLRTLSARWPRRHSFSPLHTAFAASLLSPEWLLQSHVLARQPHSDNRLNSPQAC